jgi:hypothetical protein
VLAATLESVVVDAVLVLTVPLTDESSVADIRLQAPRAHWAAAFHQVKVDTARAAAIAQAERLAGYDVPRTASLELRDLDGGSAVLTQAQWAVASKINGALNAWDLAWQCGLSLSDTFEAVGALAQSGLCAPCPVTELAADDDDWILPHRRQVRVPTQVTARAAADAGLPPAEARAAQPPLESLRRVLDGLRRL